MTVAELFLELGFDRREDFDDRVLWALTELYLRRQADAVRLKSAPDYRERRLATALCLEAAKGATLVGREQGFAEAIEAAAVVGAFVAEMPKPPRRSPRKGGGK